MTFIWPLTLYFLGLIPAIVAFYTWTLHRRRRFAVRYSSLSLVRDTLPRTSWIRRHLPFGLFILALTSLIAAASRPAAILSVPASRATLILDVDVSRRMCSEDIRPSRLQAVEAAAASFIEDQKPDTQVGIVAFAGLAELIQPPTTDRQALQAALRSLLTGNGTAMGSAILRSLDAIAGTDHSVAPSLPDSSTEIAPTPAPSGPRPPEIIVLLTDGVSDTGPSPLDAARQAAARGVRIYTVGFGTANGNAFASCQSSDPSGLGGSTASQGAPSGPSFPRGIDEATLRQIAAITGGAYYPASSLSQLQTVFDDLQSHLTVERQAVELTVVFAAAGALLAAAALALSLSWHPLP